MTGERSHRGVRGECTPNWCFSALNLRSDWFDQDLEEILLTARLFNLTHSITGILLYKDGFFLQLLEGALPEILPLFTNIKHDTRHTMLWDTLRKSDQERHFPAWNMGFCYLDKNEQLTVGDYGAFSDFNALIFKEHPEVAHRLLLSFAEGSEFAPRVQATGRPRISTRNGAHI